MESEVILYTDVIIDYLKRMPGSDSKQIFRAIKTEKLTAHMTSITVFELCRGARLSPEPERRLEEVRVLEGYIDVLSFNGEIAETASEICVSLEKKGEPLEIRDLFIGASARTYGFPLATRNITHFERIPGLQVVTPRGILDQL